MLASVIASLSQWDPCVAERLASTDVVNVVMNPTDVLNDIARERKWHGRQRPEASTWHRGMLDSVDGVDRVHSAALASLSDAAAIARRVWSGQIGVLLPFVDERRIDIISALGERLEIPFATRFKNEIITDPYDLEIGHIKYQLTSSVRVAPRLQGLVECLWTLRNELSHLRPVDLLLLQRDELIHWREIIAELV